MGWRCKRHCGFQILERSAPDMVVRSPSERVSRRRRTPKISGRDHSGRKLYDLRTSPAPRSSATVAQERFGFAAPDLDQLVEWANIIDGAQYPDAKTAVELGAPAMKLTLVIEGAKAPRSSRRSSAGCSIASWRTSPRAGDPGAVRTLVQTAPGFDGHDWRARTNRMTAWCSSILRGTIWKVITSSFRITCFRAASYTVSVSPSSFRTKVSVGSNPWAPEVPKQHLGLNSASGMAGAGMRGWGPSASSRRGD